MTEEQQELANEAEILLSSIGVDIHCSRNLYLKFIEPIVDGFLITEPIQLAEAYLTTLKEEVLRSLK